MNEQRKVKAGIIGCGNIARAYSDQISTYANCELVGFADIAQERAQQYAETYGKKAYGSPDELINDPDIEVVVNLTIHFAHYEVIKKALHAGKHVHTEKPFAMKVEEARELVELAKEKGLRLTSAPTTIMGESQQALAKLVREGKLGTVRVAYAEVNHGRIESWHPNPEPFYEVGPLWDVGIYQITLMTAILGPVRRVHGYQKLLSPNRVTKEGREFSIRTPEFYVATLDFESGAVGRLTANFYIANTRQGGSLELHGDIGSAHLGSFQGFNSGVTYGKFKEPMEEVPLAKEGFQGVEFARCMEDLADAIIHDRPHRADASHAYHVVEVILGILESASQDGKPVEITSEFIPPAPMDWA